MDIALFKKMCRLIDFQRKVSLIHLCKEGKKQGFPEHLTHKQLDYLMLIRSAMPCNLIQVMELSGLSSSAASLFVDKMCELKLLDRQLDKRDRRNIQIKPTKLLLQLFSTIDTALDRFIDEHIRDCTPEEIASMERCGAIVCRKILEINPPKTKK